MKSQEQYVVGIGASAGGVQAMVQFFPQLGYEPCACYVVVTHIGIDFDTNLHVLLSSLTDLEVEMLSENVTPLPRHVYVLPGNLRVIIKNGVLLMRKRRKEEKINLAVNEFLFSLAEDQKEKAVAVILSGMGTDGAEGAKKVHECGGLVLVQSPDSSQFSSMPRAAIHADSPQVILSATQLGKFFAQLVETRKNPPGIITRRT